MAGGDAATAPLPLADRIVIALNQVRLARQYGDLDAEFAWTTHLDALIDTYPRTRVAS